MNRISKTITHRKLRKKHQNLKKRTEFKKKYAQNFKRNKQKILTEI